MPGRNLRDARSKLKHPLINPASISSLDRRSVIAAHWSAMGQLHCPAPLIPLSPSPTRRRPFVAKLPLVLPCLLCQSHALPPLLPPQRRLFIAVLVCNGQWSRPSAWPESPSAAAARIIGVTVPETAPSITLSAVSLRCRTHQRWSRPPVSRESPPTAAASPGPPCGRSATRGSN